MSTHVTAPSPSATPTAAKEVAGRGGLVERGLDRRSLTWSIDPELSPPPLLAGWSAERYPVFPQGQRAVGSTPPSVQRKASDGQPSVPLEREAEEGGAR